MRVHTRRTPSAVQHTHTMVHESYGRTWNAVQQGRHGVHSTLVSFGQHVFPARGDKTGSGTHATIKTRRTRAHRTHTRTPAQCKSILTLRRRVVGEWSGVSSALKIYTHLRCTNKGFSLKSGDTHTRTITVQSLES